MRRYGTISETPRGLLDEITTGHDSCSSSGFEPESSGRDRRPVPDYYNSRDPLENLVFMGRFSIGRLSVYRHA
jgi:hypothetical protein